MSSLRPWSEPYSDVATLADVAACFRLLLGRNPFPEEWPGHSALAGAPLAQVVAGYLTSPEFRNRRLVRGELGSVRLRQLDGFSLFASAEDLHIGRPILESGVYEPHVAAVFRERLRPGSTVVDVGANIGFFTMLAASRVGPQGRVFAVEPGAQNLRLLNASLAANGFRNVTVFPAAAAERIVQLRFAQTYSNGFVSPDTTDQADERLAATYVLGAPLDVLIPRDAEVEFLKLDTEGFEYHVLRGAASLLRRCRPTIASEFSPPALRSGSGVEGSAYLDLLFGEGYAVSVLHKDGTLEPCGKDAAKVLSSFARSGLDHVDLLAEAA